MKRHFFILGLTIFVALGCQSTAEPTEATEASEAPQPGSAANEDGGQDAVDSYQSPGVATFAGGCFWCMQRPFDEVQGVESTVVGYTGGEEESPSYQEVVAGSTGHVEAVEIRFDADEVSYDELLDVFWRSMDPTDNEGQFADRGDHYRPFVFYHNQTQRQIAEASREQLDEHGPFDDPIVVDIVEASTFWIAEEYHQDYYKKNPEQYEAYYAGSGRKGFLEQVWGE